MIYALITGFCGLYAPISTRTGRETIFKSYGLLIRSPAPHDYDYLNWYIGTLHMQQVPILRLTVLDSPIYVSICLWFRQGTTAQEDPRHPASSPPSASRAEARRYFAPRGARHPSLWVSGTTPLAGAQTGLLPEFPRRVYRERTAARQSKRTEKGGWLLTGRQGIFFLASWCACLCWFCLTQYIIITIDISRASELQRLYHAPG